MINVSLDDAYRLVSCGSIVMITTHDGNGNFNAMTCAWNCPLDFNPSKLLLIIGRESKTRQNIEKTGEFIVCIPSTKQKDLALKIGSCHGFDVDKFKEFGIKYSLGEKVKAPFIDGSLAFIECKLIPEPEYTAKYDIILGEVLKATADENYFDGNMINPKNDDYSTLHHLADDKFRILGKTI